MVQDKAQWLTPKPKEVQSEYCILHHVNGGSTYVGYALFFKARVCTTVPSSLTYPKLPSPSSAACIQPVINADAIPAAFAPLISQ